jgi:predicted ATPase
VFGVALSADGELLVSGGAEGNTEGRYGFLETIRQYAEDQLLRSGEAAAARDRHREWCLTPKQFSVSDSEEQFALLAAELDTVRAAMS